MQCEPENRKLVTHEQREAYGWRLLTRKLRQMGLNDSAARLERALDADDRTANLDIAVHRRNHGTRPTR